MIEKDNRIRILQIISGMGSGGAEMFLMNMYRNMDHNKIVFDFLLQSGENLYKEELQTYGSIIHTIPQYFKHPLQNHAELRKVLNNDYSIIHVHANALLYITPIIYAHKANIPCRIMHSHNSSLYYKWALPYHRINKLRIKKHATHRFACSNEAGRWMFDSDFTVIRNAIDLDRFAFSSELREKHRRELGISDEALVIGQIGRLWEVKNQSFTLDVLKHVLSQRDDCELLFVGEGSDEQMLKKKAHDLGIEEHVRFLGVRTDVHSLINAFDILAFPSLYEGLPIVMVESQANGLSVICSTAIPKECIFSKNIRRIPLEEGEKAWADAIISTEIQRTDNRSELVNAGYDIKEEARKLQDFYLSVAKEK